MALPTSGYVNGSDILVAVGGKAMGHCTSHTTTYNSETKDRAVKPKQTVTTIGAGLWKEKTVTGLSVQIKVDGLTYYGEDATGAVVVLGKWKTGDLVDITAFVRSQDAKPYLSGQFVIASIEESESANEDSTYNVTFDNSGMVTINEAYFTGTSEATE